MHTEEANSLKFCHYFNNKKICPYSDIGCMFRHESAPNCNFRDKCSKNLCQFQYIEEVFKKCDNCEFFDTSSESLKIIPVLLIHINTKKCLIITTMMTNISNAIIVLTFQKVVF